MERKMGIFRGYIGKTWRTLGCAVFSMADSLDDWTWGCYSSRHHESNDMVVGWCLMKIPVGVSLAVGLEIYRLREMVVS